MIDAYNFLASWQLFPERGSFEIGSRPKSGTYRIELAETGKALRVIMNWVSFEDQAFSSSYSVPADGELYPTEDGTLGDHIKIVFTDLTNFETHFYKEGKLILLAVHHITSKGYLQVTHKHFFEDNTELINVEVYHKQLSVLPYSASVSGAVIKATQDGVIRHHALSAMEEQTNMQLTQIRQQIELLAIQAKEIYKRKELSMLIYDAKLSFEPVIGKVYYLYEKEDGTHLLSMIGPKEWGRKVPYKNFISAVQLLADHTWKEI
jgi:hypothetical protein